MSNLTNQSSEETHAQPQTTKRSGKLSELRRKKYVHYFRLWDVEHRGYMTFEDYALLTRRTADLNKIPEDSDVFQGMMAYTKANWDEMLRNADVDQDGKLSLKEWMDFTSLFTNLVIEGQYPRIEELEQFGRTIFSLIDQDGDGKIYAEHWHRFTKVWGIDGDPIDMFMRLDPGDKGHMVFEDLMDRYYEFLLSDDDTVPGNFLFGSFR